MIVLARKIVIGDKRRQRAVCFYAPQMPQASDESRGQWSLGGMPVKDKTTETAGHRQRLREKFMDSGLEGFQDYEVVELLLSLSTPRRDCKPMAKAAMKKFKSLQGVLDASLEQLCEIFGIGPNNAVALKLIRAVATRYFRGGLQKLDLAADPKALINYLMTGIGWRERECFEVIFLDAKNCVIATEIMFEGSITQSVVYIREIVKAVLRYNAVSIICAHNHPSGNTKPSADDVLVTQKIVDAGNLVGFNVTEHLVVSSSDYFSFRDNGIFEYIKKELEAIQKNELLVKK